MRIFGTEAFKKNGSLEKEMRRERDVLDAFAMVAGHLSTKGGLPPKWGPNAPRGRLETPLPRPSRKNEPVVDASVTREMQLVEDSPNVHDMQERRRQQLISEEIAEQKLLFKRRPIEALQGAATADQIAIQPIEIPDTNSSVS